MRQETRKVKLALAAGLIALGTAPAFGQSGPDQTEKLVKSVESTMKSIGEARQQLEKTLAGYNSIMEQTAKDTKDAYKSLGKDIAESEKKVADSTLKVDEMNAEAARQFTAWKAAGKDARASFDALMKDLKDQTTFLGSDLNASAIASLKPDATKFNARAKTVLGKIDGVNKMFADYVASIRP
jgi:septal ring factor EnvC (AmiA/AmiB activator)